MSDELTIKDIIREYTDVFYLNDTSVIPLILAITIGTKVKGDPIWLMLIGASSGGKSELINIVSKVNFAHQVSNLTENTFLSGMKATRGNETSFLHKVGNVGMIIMKDYTSILAMRQDKRDNIIAQMREIYDGHLTKKTGNDADTEWRGKVNFLGGVTDKIYVAEESSAGMGRRAIFYSLPDATNDERINMTKAARMNLFDIKEKRNRIAELTAKFVNQTIKKFPAKLPKIDDDFADDIIKLSNFVTIARTPTERDFHGSLKLAIRPELPTRMSQQLFMIATILNVLDGRTQKYHKELIYKIALDSIPIQRRLVLRQLAEYETATAKGVGQAIYYPTETALEWIEDLNVLKICRRENNYGIVGPDKFKINKRWREIMIDYDNIKYKKDVDLTDNEDSMFSEPVDPMFQRIHDKGVAKQMADEAKEAGSVFGSFY